MSFFTIVYLLYSTKLASQASVYFIWLVEPSSRTIPFVAAAVAILASFPFFHIIVHVFTQRPLSSPAFIAYLCFSCVLAILWFEPNRAGEQRVLPFVLVTAFDLLALLVFLFQRQIDRWRVVLTPDIEQACGAAGEVEGKGQESLRSAAAEPETPQTEARLRVMDNLGYNVRAVNRAGLGAPSLLTRPRSGNTVQLSDGSGGSDLVTVGNAASRRRPSAAITALSPTSAGLSFAALHSVQEMGDDEIVRGQPPKRFSKMILALGMDGGASSLQHACSPDSAVSPATIMSEIHPAMRPAPTDPGRTRTAASRRSESHPPTDPKTCEPSQV